jgi:hypothetical protein
MLHLGLVAPALIRVAGPSRRVLHPPHVAPLGQLRNEAGSSW